MPLMNKDVFFSLAHNLSLEELKFIMWNHLKKEKDLAKIVSYIECIIWFQSHIKALKINLSNHHLPEQFFNFYVLLLF